METVTIEREALKDMVVETFREYLDSTFQDVDEIRRSPAGHLIRLEGKIDSLEKELKGEIEALRKELKGDIGALDGRLTGEIAALRVKIGTLEKQSWVILAAVITGLIKYLFFS